MALKLNIRPELEEEMDDLLPKTAVRSKTEYINKAIAEYNFKLKHQMEIVKIQKYFQTYKKEGRQTLSDFAELRKANPRLA